ncbi:hypothetical protein RRG08_007587 [Elysia crispata]|uniref:DNA-directed DNA polymerase n=1 Tax=Elysia crispata TaxID=231223 RepID=A0AAE0YT54_9GAST|nr:hypothetical protein RRG08_007587 [Elysia crispata]
MPGNRADSRQGGNASPGQEQAHFPEPPQAAASTLHYLRRFRSPHHESRGTRARPDKEQHPEDTSPRGMQLLLCQGAVRREDRGACRIPGAQRGRTLQEEERGIKKALANPQTMRMTSTDWESHRTARRCHVCDGLLEGDSVRDHCHITGKYRGAAHNACNLKLRLNPKTTTIPVVFHNLRGYDSHLLMQVISKVEGRISCIPNNTEKYISFSLG